MFQIVLFVSWKINSDCKGHCEGKENLLDEWVKVLSSEQEFVYNMRTCLNVSLVSDTNFFVLMVTIMRGRKWFRLKNKSSPCSKRESFVLCGLSFVPTQQNCRGFFSTSTSQVVETGDIIPVQLCKEMLVIKTAELNSLQCASGSQISLQQRRNPSVGF